MLRWAILFLVISLIAGGFGFANIWRAAGWIDSTVIPGERREGVARPGTVINW